MTLQQKILKIHGNPDYVYYHDGISGKCYRKTGVRTLSAGRVIEENQIAQDMQQHDASPQQFPVVVFNSCATCQGIELYYSLTLDHIDVKFTSGGVASIPSTGKLFDITVDHISVNGVPTGQTTTPPAANLFDITIDHIAMRNDTGFSILSGLATHDTNGRVYTEGIHGQTIAPPEDHSKVGELSAWGYTDNSAKWDSLPI